MSISQDDRVPRPWPRGQLIVTLSLIPIGVLSWFGGLAVGLAVAGAGRGANRGAARIGRARREGVGGDPGEAPDRRRPACATRSTSRQMARAPRAAGPAPAAVPERPRNAERGRLPVRAGADRDLPGSPATELRGSLLYPASLHGPRFRHAPRRLRVGAGRAVRTGRSLVPRREPLMSIDGEERPTDLGRIHLVALDMDGTIYRGKVAARRCGASSRADRRRRRWV